MCPRRPTWRPAAISAAALSLLLLACNVVLGDRAEGSEPVEVPESVAPPNSYEFTVYALDQTTRQTGPNGTLFQFDENDLPFSINSICFGDFRLDQEYCTIYYGCSGILLNASGGNAGVSLREGFGKTVMWVDYHGQDPIVLNSEVRRDSFTEVTAYTGTDIFVLDWVDGTWNPRVGAFIEHPENVTFTDATFFVMVFEPSLSAEVPEFSLPLMVCALTLVICVFRLRKRP